MVQDGNNAALQDILLNMQVQTEEAQLTQCWPEWRELNYRPSYNKLYFIVDGEGWLKIGDQELYPQPGQLILMPANKEQSYSVMDGRPPFYKFWCHFTATAGQMDVFRWLELPYCFDGFDREQMVSLFQSLVDAHNQNTISSRLKAKSALLHILAVILERQPLQIGAGGIDLERLTLIQQYVDRHLHKELSAQELASVMHLHPNYFSKYFKRHFGMSPLKYVSRKKMEHAKLLLKSTPQSIKEIALATGFEDANYFSKTFRREVGYSPSEYRLNV